MGRLPMGKKLLMCFFSMASLLVPKIRPKNGQQLGSDQGACNSHALRTTCCVSCICHTHQRSTEAGGCCW